MQDYHIPAAPVCIEYEIKRSQFIANIGHTPSKVDALDFIKTISAQYADARHNCWAYIAGHPIESIERASSDAGEPSGTAGKPMLNVLQHKHVGEITVVVSRYFGGIKLGAGGLVRAYSTSVQMAMDALTLKQVIATIPAEISFPFALENQIRHILQSHGVDICSITYAEKANMTLLVPYNLKASVKDIIYDKTQGKVEMIYPIHVK